MNAVIDYASYASFNRLLIGKISSEYEFDWLDAARVIEALLFSESVELLGRKGFANDDHANYLNPTWTAIRNLLVDSTLLRTTYISANDWNRTYQDHSVDFTTKLEGESYRDNVRRSFDRFMGGDLCTRMDWSTSKNEVIQEAAINEGLFDTAHSALIALVCDVAESHVKELHAITMDPIRLKQVLDHPFSHTIEQIKKFFVISANVRGYAYRSKAHSVTLGHLKCSMIRPPLFSSKSCSDLATVPSTLAFAFGVTDYLSQLKVNARPEAIVEISKSFRPKSRSIASRSHDLPHEGAAEYAFECIRDNGLIFESPRKATFVGLGIYAASCGSLWAFTPVGELLKSIAVANPGFALAGAAGVSLVQPKLFKELTEKLNESLPGPVRLSRPGKELIESWQSVSE